MDWIPLSKKLPPEDVPVWVYDKHIKQPIIAVRIWESTGWLWYRCYDDYWYDKGWKTSTSAADAMNVTHWQPLPEPPS